MKKLGVMIHPPGYSTLSSFIRDDYYLNFIIITIRNTIDYIKIHFSASFSGMKIAAY